MDSKSIAESPNNLEVASETVQLRGEGGGVAVTKWKGFQMGSVKLTELEV